MAATKRAVAPRRIKKKVYKKRKTFNPSSLATRYKFSSRVKGPLPPKLNVCMIYADNAKLNPGLAASTGIALSCNGLYDPYVAAGGHQPRGFDELIALYDHYVVTNAKITVWYSHQPASADQQALVSITVRDNSTIVTSAIDVVESRVNVSKVLGIATGDHTGSLELEVNPNLFLGRSNPLADPHLKGSNGSNPTEQAYFHLNVTPMDATQDIGSCAMWYRIEYQATMIEPKQPAQS